MRKKPKIKKRIKLPRNRQRKKKIKLLLSIPVILIVLVFPALSFYTPKVTLKLKGEKIGNIITINYKEKFRQPEYIATYQNKDITDKVEVVGTVNSSKLGKYKIYYKTHTGIFKKTRVLTVIVRDISAPSIKLLGKKNTDVCPKSTYKEEGYKAYDNLEGEITEKVKVKRLQNKIIYSVKDSANNYNEVVRTLIYQDKTPPTIRLAKEAYETIYVGEKYQDPGASAIDNCNGDISEKIITRGTVDTSKPGKYELIYQIMDEANNKAEIKRTVNVVEHGQNGTIYLTFDDGPKIGTTDVILDILKEENIKATFFITNNGPDELVIREYQEGHTVGLHTASHDYSYIYSSVESYYEDLNRVRNRVRSLTGKEANIIRFPGGSSNTISRRYSSGIMTILTKDVLAKGFYYYDWNLASGDAGELHTADDIYNHVIKNLSKDRINMVLMHDIKPYTRDALKRIIQYGKENGYCFDKITEKTEMLTQRVNN